jgi:hypothetical protein
MTGAVYQFNVSTPPPRSGEETDDGNGGGPHMPNMSDLDRRLTTLEGEQRNHFRWTIGALLIAFGILVTLSIGIANFISGRVDRLDDRLGKVETGVADLPNKINQNLMQLNQTLLQAVLAGATQRHQESLPPPSPPTSSTPSPSQQ